MKLKKIFLIIVLLLTFNCFSGNKNSRISDNYLIGLEKQRLELKEKLNHTEQLYKTNHPDYNLLLTIYQEIYNQNIDSYCKMFAAYRLGRIFYFKQEYESCLNYFKEAYQSQKLSNNLNAYIIYAIARIYYDHYPRNNHYSRVINYFNETYNQDYNKDIKLNAAFYLGRIYLLGYGVNINYNKAFKFFNYAINNQPNENIKIHIALFLGKMYKDGLGTEQDFKLAYDLFNLAYNQKLNLKIQTRALAYLTQMSYEGYTDTKCIVNARLDFKKIFNENLDTESKIIAAYYLGEIYYLGKGVEKDIEIAIHYLNFSHNQELLTQYKINSAYHLATIYSSEFNFLDTYKTLLLFQEIYGSEFIELKNKATWNLAKIYYCGHGIEGGPDYQRAKQYFTEVINNLQENQEIREKAEYFLNKINNVENPFRGE